MAKRQTEKPVIAVCDQCADGQARDTTPKPCVDMGRYRRVTGFASEVRYLCEQHCRGLGASAIFKQAQ